MDDRPAFAIECTGLEYRFGAAKTVDGVDLRVKPGEVFGLPRLPLEPA